MVKNFFSTLDIISPKITLFYDGNKRYSTNLGGIFTIIVCCAAVFQFLDQLLSYINFDINNIIYYRKYLNEFGPYKINIDKNSLFFYINFIDNTDNSQNNIINIDLSKIRLVGLFNGEIKIREESYFDQEHWLFGNCNTTDIDEELQKISGKNFKKSICLKYFYNTETKQYYSISDKNFKSPTIFNSSEYFTVYTYKCINNSITNQIYGNCSSEDEIIDYIENNPLFMKYNFLNHQLNPNNYKNPVKLFINSITSKIEVKDYYISNSVTFTPLIIEKEKSVFFSDPSIYQTFSYQDYKKVSSGNTNQKDILNLFYIAFENLGQYYKYSYKTLYGIFERVTILVEVIHYIFFIINYIYNLIIGNINIQNIIFHKKLPSTHKIRHLFTDNYDFNLRNGYFKKNNIIISVTNKSKVNSKKTLFNKISTKNKGKDNRVSQKDSAMILEQNISNFGQLNNQNNQNAVSFKKVDVYKSDYKYDEDKIYGKMKFSSKEIILFFKYLACNKWNNSPLLLFDSIQKKLISVEHLFQIHLFLLTLKRQRRRTNMVDIYKFFYER